MVIAESEVHSSAEGTFLQAAQIEIASTPCSPTHTPLWLPAAPVDSVASPVCHTNAILVPVKVSNHRVQHAATG